MTLHFENTLMGKMALGDRISISVATANALESALGIRQVMDEFGNKIEDHANDRGMIKKFNEVHLNLRTLIRNFLGCIDKDHREKVFPVLVAEGIVHEVKEIIRALETYAPENLKLQIYLCTYEDIEKQFKHATFKETSTQKQVDEKQLEKDVIENVLKMINNVKVYKTNIKGKFGKTLMLTHHSIDLLSADSFMDLKLLESHTGAIKGKSEWKTKLTGAKDISIPFNRLTLQAFGDSSGIFKPVSSAIKKVLINMSIYYKWHPLTKEEKFIKDIKSAAIDRDIKSSLLALL